MSAGFVVASKKMAKAKVAMIGPSGSGKIVLGLEAGARAYPTTAASACSIQ